MSKNSPQDPHYDPYYDHIAQGYEELHREEQLRKIAIIKAHVAIRPDDLLLDVGCGTGLTCDFPCCVVGLDPAIALLQRTPKSLPIVQAEAEHIPFADDSFDIVSSVTAIQNFRDIRKGLEEIRRVGKDRFILTFLAQSAKRDAIKAAIEELFVVDKVIEEDYDVIHVCHKDKQ